jgi:hypothetical protein
MIIFYKLLKDDIDVILRCISVVLESGKLYPEEIATRIGVESQFLLTLIKVLQQIFNIASHEDTFKSFEISDDKILIAIHNCLNEVAYGIDMDDDILKLHYGISRLVVQEVFNRWISIENSLKNDIVTNYLS